MHNYSQRESFHAIEIHHRAALQLHTLAVNPASNLPRSPYRVLVLSSISIQLVKTEYKELEGVYRIGWAGLTQRV
jgi:hypothetical protein